jgi:hypothetical protein
MVCGTAVAPGLHHSHSTVETNRPPLTAAKMLICSAASKHAAPDKSDYRNVASDRTPWEPPKCNITSLAEVPEGIRKWLLCHAVIRKRQQNCSSCCVGIRRPARLLQCGSRWPMAGNSCRECSKWFRIHPGIVERHGQPSTMWT